MSHAGTYTLLFAVPESIEVRVGALGTREFPAGGYAYTGSALGSGGFSRIDRHRRVAAGEHDVRHWHVDYLGGHPGVSLAGVERVGDGVDAECRIARTLSAGPIDGFGSSDCDCQSHLARYGSPDAARAAVADAYAALGGTE
ncbi:GIY-YIG nuclease family protein [Halobaculum sp. CBA1158]|uniref:GIY-YIG nuclease family protein n=1 Tax=Halobaculum sp. CBA1158 TaxID=2904243 RepID=UPI001F1B68C5|nr:GIY-YIG nuclease family protein [Halobaculum sp. CBA1158]UIO98809.1 GIY-YIG nuclease family protein [Halobaculum sp. CBA1158]